MIKQILTKICKNFFWIKSKPKLSKPNSSENSLYNSTIFSSDSFIPLKIVNKILNKWTCDWKLYVGRKNYVNLMVERNISDRDHKANTY